MNKILLSGFMLFSCFVQAQQNSFHAPRQQKNSFANVPGFSFSAINGATAQSPVLNPPFTPQPYLHVNQATVNKNLSIKRDPSSGLPLMIAGLEYPAAVSGDNAQAVADAIMLQINDVLGLASSTKMQKVQFEQDNLGYSHIKLQQLHNGIPVFGAQAWIHISQDGRADFSGRLIPSVSSNAVNASLGIENAKVIASSDVEQHSAFHAFDENLWQMKQFETELVYYGGRNFENKCALAWHITIRPNAVYRWEYFIDATTGAVLNKFDNTCSLGPTTAQAADLNGVTRTIQTFNANSTHYLIDATKSMFTGSLSSKPGPGTGIVTTLDFQNTTMQNPNYVDFTSPTNNWSGKAGAVSAHYNASVSFDYFKNTHGRNSINGNGGDVVSFVNVADDGGGGLDNAFWNGQYMFYGNGAQSFFPLAGGLDVGGHEMTHGVVQSTANLVYQDEPGALNESFADVFGCSVDPADWKLGEDVVKPTAYPSGALRDMQDPHNGGNSLNDNGWQPSHMNEKYTGSQDNGGVHINSGIANKAYYLIATAITRTKAEKIYYRALANYLTQNSKFIDCRLAVVRAAEDLHGANSAESNACKTAFDQVGILDGNPTNTTPTLPTNPGVSKLLLLNLDSQDPNTIYLTDNTASNFTPISQTPVLTKPSVTDDGSLALFVGQDNNIYSIQLNPPYNQQALTTDAYWYSVAVSKDGNNLAATSKFVDTAIWVYSSALQQWAKYELYNPTTGQGQTAGGVEYAEALDWSYDGNFLMYDAYNKINGAGGAFLDYWDIGILNAWSGSNFGNGQIYKVYNNLDEGVNIGNPTFAKNSPYIIAFDYFESGTSSYAVLAANLEDNQTGTIFENNVFGSPTYSPQDNKIAFNSQDNQSIPVLAFIDVDASKINGNAASATAVVNQGGYAQWFGTGDRPLAIEEQERVVFQVYPNPVSDRLYVNMSAAGNDFSYEVFNLLGEKLMEGKSKDGAADMSVLNLSSGSYIMQLTGGQTKAASRFIKW